MALGTARQTLVVLHEEAKMPVQQGHAGMYHFAFGVPFQAEFSRLLARFAGIGLRVAPVDHTMSKAIYLSDPDGHGIEIAFETPERFGGFIDGTLGYAMIDHRGRMRSGRDPLAIDAEMAFAQGADLTAPISDDTLVAHLHLHVPDLDAAVEWFECIGFARNLILPEIGMADMGAGAANTHRRAVNTWAGKDVIPAPSQSARPLGYRLVTSDHYIFDLAGTRLARDAAGLRSGRDAAGIALTLALDRGALAGQAAA
jgi:catechol 2,3-dioxygenase